MAYQVYGIGNALLDIQYETSKIRQKYGINSYQLFEIIDRNRNAN